MWFLGKRSQFQVISNVQLRRRLHSRRAQLEKLGAREKTSGGIVFNGVAQQLAHIGNLKQPVGGEAADLGRELAIHAR